MFFGGGMPFETMRQPGNVDNSKYYNLLNVAKDANEKDITKSFRKMAMKLHPDRPDGDAEKFKEINKAYEVLNDPEKRKLYDQYGEEGLSEEGMNASQTHEMFSRMFGENNNPFGGMRRPQQRQEQKTDSVGINVEVKLKELYTGCAKQVKIKRKKVVNDGKKVIDTICNECNGQGIKIQVIRMGPMIQQSQQKCNKCNGTGKIIQGKKIVEDLVTLDLVIDKGMKEGDKKVFHGMADETLYKKPGDVIFIVKEVPDPNFERKGNHLFHKRKILLCDALCGCEFVLKLINNTQILVKTDSIITNDSLYIINNRGMPINGNQYNCGDLYIQFEVIYPNIETINKENTRTLLQSVLPYDKTVIENKENLEQTLLKKNNTNTIPEERKQNDDDEDVRVHHQENCHQQ